jgi:hypothetical protein
VGLRLRFVVWLLVIVAVAMATQVRLSHGEPVWAKKPPLSWINDRR